MSYFGFIYWTLLYVLQYCTFNEFLLFWLKTRRWASAFMMSWFSFIGKLASPINVIVKGLHFSRASLIQLMASTFITYNLSQKAKSSITESAQNIMQIIKVFFFFLDKMAVLRTMKANGRSKTFSVISVVQNSICMVESHLKFASFCKCILPLAINKLFARQILKEILNSSIS